MRERACAGANAAMARIRGDRMNLATLPGLLGMLHALAGIGFIVGLFGRWMVLAAAERAETPAQMRLLTRVAAPFETLVIVGSLVVFILGVLTAWAMGLPLLGPLVGAPVNWLFVSLVLYLSILPLVPLVFLPRGRVFESALDEAENAGIVTDALRQAWSDPVVRGAHVYELTAVTVVLVLMLAKPF